MSPTGLCLHNKSLLPAKLLQCLLSQLEILAIFLGAPCWDCGDSDLSSPLSPGCIPRKCQEKIPSSVNGQLDPEGDLSSQQVRVRASDAQRNPVRHKNKQGEGSTTHQTCKDPGSNSNLPQEAEGEINQLPETTSNHLLG
jgi:hypothetical protein